MQHLHNSVELGGYPVHSHKGFLCHTALKDRGCHSIVFPHDNIWRKVWSVMTRLLYIAAEPMPHSGSCLPRGWLRAVSFLCTEDAQCGYCGQIARLGIVNRLPKELLTLRRHHILCSSADSCSTSHVERSLS